MKISIVGSGVCGQATGKGFRKFGHEVVFYDIDAKKLAELKDSGYNVSNSVKRAVGESELIFVSVPTPTVNGSLDFSFVESAIISVAEALKDRKKYGVVVIRSTVLPSTTRSRVVPLIEKYSKLRVGNDFGVCMNPEFLREKFSSEDFLNPSRIVIGEFDKKSGDYLEEAYASIKSPIIRTNLESAEIIKYASNLFLATKISFFNELYGVCRKLGVSADLVGKAVSLDPRIGEYGVYAGRPFDGKCLPKDLDAFRSYVKSLGIDPKLLDAVSAVNHEMDSFNTTGNM